VLSQSRLAFEMGIVHWKLHTEDELLADADSLRGRTGPATLIIYGPTRQDYINNEEQIRAYCLAHNILIRRIS